MVYRVYRSDGIPLADFKRINVCRSGRFVDASFPMVDDIFNVVTKHETLSYCVYAVVNQSALTIKVMSKR